MRPLPRLTPDQIAARRVRYRRRQTSSEWLISAARLAAGLPAVASAGDDSWVRPERPARCRWRVAEAVGVHHGEGRAAHWSGLERCASIWSCPVCSAVIRSERAREVQAAADQWREQGGSTVMVTLTIRHRLADPLEVGLHAAVEGWRLLTAHRVWKNLRKRLGLVGFIRAIEVTWTYANGWHPHVHALLFAEGTLAPEEVAALEGELFAAWERIVVRLGARRPSRAHGVKVTRGAADYIAKVQEHDRAGVEMTRFDLKKSRAAAGLMPFELLDVEGETRARARHLWTEYVTATKGRRAITWSRGLKARFDLEDLTDDEVIESTEVDDLRVLIPGDQYDARVRNRPGRATAVLELVESGDLVTAARLSGGFLAVPEGAGGRAAASGASGPPRRGLRADDEHPEVTQ